MVSITNTTRKNLPSFPLEEMKNSILGKHYSLSIVVIGKTRCHALNKTYRNMDKPTDVLSFPLEKNEGELFICPQYVKEHPSKYSVDGYKNQLAFLIIHGMLHLKGFNHGSTMESKERKWMKDFFGVTCSS